MKRKSRAPKPKDAKWPLLTISEELLAAAEKLRDAETEFYFLSTTLWREGYRRAAEAKFYNFPNYVAGGGWKGGILMEIEEICSDYKPQPQIKFTSPEGRNRGLEAFPLLEACCRGWLCQFIDDLRRSVTKTRRIIEASPWMFTGKEIYDAKSLLMKVARKQGAVSAFLHKDLCGMFYNKDMNWEMFTPNPTTSMDDLLACHLNKERKRLMADPKTFSGIHPLVQLLNQNLSSKRLCLPLEAIADIELRPTTKRLLAQNPHKPLELAQLNRLLLEDAFDRELVKSGEVGVPSSESVIQGVPCGSAFTDPDLLKFDRAADQLEEELSSFRSSLEDEEVSFSLQRRAQRLQRIREQARELSEFATSIFTTPSALGLRIIKVLRLQNKPIFSFPPPMFWVDEHEPLLLFDVPLNLFFAGPIVKLCWILRDFNSWRSHISVDLETRQIIQNIHALFHACYPFNYGLCRPCGRASDDDLASSKRILQQCVESLRNFVTIALSDPAKVNPGSPVVVAAAKTSPAPATSATLGPAPDKTSVPKPDPQSFTVKLDRVGGTRKPVLANISVQLKGPTDEEWQSCKGASKQTLLALFVILGKDGQGKVPRTRFVELCFAPVKGAVLAAQVDHMFENRCGGNNSLKEQYDLHLVNEGTGRKTNEITGPHFETNLTQDEVEQHLKGGPKTPCGGKRSR